MIARLSPSFSAIAPNMGAPNPHARFWIAMAMEKSARGQPNSVAMGIWNIPNDPRMAKPVITMTQPAIRTGVNRADLVCMGRVFQTPAPMSNRPLCGQLSRAGMDQSAAQP